MSCRKLLKRLAQLSWSDWGLLGETLFCLTKARLLVRVLPFPALAKRLGEHMAETGAIDHPAREPFLTSLTWTVGALSRRLPWRCQCLEQALAAQMLLRRRNIPHEQALAAQMLLRRRNIPHTLYLGARLEQGRLEAHAWVRCGVRLVTGDHGEAFPVVSCFAQWGSEA
jgi:hypothetical protein